jgi:hypothetical protein
MDKILLIVILALAALMVLMQIVVMMRISRVERVLLSLRGVKSEESVSVPPQRAATHEKSYGQGLFDQFLAEDPKRKLMKKSESSEAFRVWRKEHGMTWQKHESEEDAEA